MQADPITIKQAAQELGLDVPIGAVKVVGDRLELTLYGGRVVTWFEQPQNLPRGWPEDPFLREMLEKPNHFKREELRQLGEWLNIEGAGKMNKVSLVKAIKKWKDAQMINEFREKYP